MPLRVNCIRQGEEPYATITWFRLDLIKVEFIGHTARYSLHE